MSLPPSPLTHLIASYAILPALASWMTEIDLYHLAATSRSHFAYILGSSALFSTLRRQCICAGSGLNQCHRHISKGEPAVDPLEHVLPCCKCGVNVCGECRDRVYTPRHPRSVGSRPHRDGNGSVRNIVCLCPECDVAAAEEVAGRDLSDMCECDTIDRWICVPCAGKETKRWNDYKNQHIKFSRDAYNRKTGQFATKIIEELIVSRAVWCKCGAQVPQTTIPRCMWCEKRLRRADVW